MTINYHTTPGAITYVRTLPSAIVNYLDKRVIGHPDVKRALAIAVCNRERRLALDHAMQEEIKPKNILMVGPTGVGKTELVRCLAKHLDAPFVKVEATKFTEVGYVGKDVDSIIKDLLENALKFFRKKAYETVKPEATKFALRQVVEALQRRYQKLLTSEDPEERSMADFLTQCLSTHEDDELDADRKFLILSELVLSGKLDDWIITIEMPATNHQVEILAMPGMEEMVQQLQGLFQGISGNRKKKQKISVKSALSGWIEQECSERINDAELRITAIEAVESRGIVFLDEIDKIVRRSSHSMHGEPSREGVQRDLLPLIEGTVVSTRFGSVRTDHILFIASGAFHHAKPSDLIAELQGRLPIVVTLKSLTVKDFEKILVEPDYSLLEQYRSLLAVDGVVLNFTACGIRCLAQRAYDENDRQQNIGARRLFAVLESVLSDLSFQYPVSTSSETISVTINIDAAYVNDHYKLTAIAPLTDAIL
jgi:ATP-dependent HslUV protease ATP-binding subunit HslU